MTERDDLVRNHYLAGKSRGETMELVGIQNTNSMASLSNRLGFHWSWPLEYRVKNIAPVQAPKPGKPKPHRRVLTEQAPLSVMRKAKPIKEPEPEVLAEIIPLGQRRTLLQLNEDTCSWPVGDPANSRNGDGSFFFCGGKPLGSLPYCNYHSRIAYQPEYVRKRDRPLRPFRR